MRRLFRVLAALGCLWPGTALPQADGLATLVADRVEIAGAEGITAAGNVEVIYGDVRLTATSVRYDRAGDQLTIEGPITLIDGESTMVLADAAELGADLRNGILRGARLVLDQQLQLAAARIDRVGGRYTQLSRTVASSCQICADDPVPLWEIRARKVIHDQQERQIYYEGAQFRFVGLPIAYVPYLRMPDPTLRRATGVLFPEIRTSSLLGTGLRTPYFFALGDHADFLLTPFVSAETTTFEGRYRQEFSFGSLLAEGAISRDTLRDKPRAYLFASGDAALPLDFRLNYNLQLVSDPSYLSDYSYSGRDRLRSAVSLSRTSHDEYLSTGATVYRTLRRDELTNESEIVDREIDFSYTRRLPPTALGGTTWLTFDATAFARPSDADEVGRDVARAGIALDWDRDWIVGPGVIVAAEAGLEANHYEIAQDSTYPSSVDRLTPRTALTLRWPLSRIGDDGAMHILEPVAQLGWSETHGGDVPNEDSALVEFDEGNLFSLSRFPGSDRSEDGLRANLGIGYTRHDPDDWSLGLTLGRVLRIDAPDTFADSTGLSGSSSDWLIAAQYRLDNRLLVTSRTLIDDRLDVTRSETRLTLSGAKARISSAYTYIDEALAEGRPDPASEWIFDGSYDFGRHWTGRANWRYDTEAGRAARAGLGVSYRNECIGVDLSLSRRFTSSATVLPTTDFSFRVTLQGVGSGGDARRYRRACSG